MIASLMKLWPMMHQCMYGRGDNARGTLQEYASGRRCTRSNDEDEVVRWFGEVEAASLLAFAAQCERDERSKEDVVVLVQFADKTRVLMTNLVTNRVVLRHLLSPSHVIVGKDLGEKWEALLCAIRKGGRHTWRELVEEEGSIATTNCVDAAWHEVTDLLPLHGAHATTESLVRFVLDKTAAWQRSHDTIGRPTWSKLADLTKRSLLRAECNVGYVMDIVLTLKREVETEHGVFPWHV